MEKNVIVQALTELRKTKERKFKQSVELLINLKKFDMKKDNVNLLLTLPHKIKPVKICAFLNKRNSTVDTIIKDEFHKYETDKKEIKKLVKNYDFFIASANLMPLVAKSFGRYLGQAGKMPNPQLGVLKDETDAEIKKVSDSFEKVVRIKSKEPSLKLSIGKESLKDEDIAENALHVYEKVTQALPKQKENIRSVMIRFTMTKPIKIE